MLFFYNTCGESGISHTASFGSFTIAGIFRIRSHYSLWWLLITFRYKTLIPVNPESFLFCFVFDWFGIDQYYQPRIIIARTLIIIEIPRMISKERSFTELFTTTRRPSFLMTDNCKFVFFFVMFIIINFVSAKIKHSDKFVKLFIHINTIFIIRHLFAGINMKSIIH